jgi:hypothetical protein
VMGTQRETGNVGESRWEPQESTGNPPGTHQEPSGNVGGNPGIQLGTQECAWQNGKLVASFLASETH